MSPEPSRPGPSRPEPLAGLEVRDGVATITLNSPHNRNALSRRLLSDLAARLDEVSPDTAGVIVLRAAGPAFCAGADLKEAGDGRGPGPVSMPDILTRIIEHPLPVLARVHAAVRAGGIGLVAACDIALAPASSTFAFTETRIGVVPAIISVPVLTRMPMARVRTLFLTGETFDGAQAAEWGLLDVAVGDGDLDRAVRRYTDRLLLGEPGAQALIKRLCRTVPRQETGEALAAMQALSEARFASAEGREGVAAFRERRQPSWVARFSS